MTNVELWAENDLLLKRLQELQRQLAAENEERLRLKAENLWIKRLLQRQKDLREQQSGISPHRA